MGRRERDSGEGEEMGRERRERPGTLVHHQVSALTIYNENNKTLKVLLIIPATNHNINNNNISFNPAALESKSQRERERERD